MPAVGKLEDWQLAAWRQLQRMHFQLTAKLSRELAAQTGLSYQDYLVLFVLRDRPEHRMRAFELGNELAWEKSRLSHHVARMEQRGLVRREKCATDHRGAFVVLTARGRKAIEVAAPLHESNVRRHFVDLVAPDELRTLSEAARRVLEKLAADDAGPRGGTDAG
ncbi:MAG TPA: MarR family winged helix-turn-helix transcriptional regulator [Acidimicrobiales bacterium]|nr:MarR family winged helix-turn-helix transcriptional regulator [Acidimicrobiales bacterium]